MLACGVRKDLVTTAWSIVRIDIELTLCMLLASFGNVIVGRIIRLHYNIMALGGEEGGDGGYDSWV